MRHGKRIEASILAGSSRLLWMLLGFSIFDALVTDFGLRFELIEEANPMIHYVYSRNLSGYYLIKIGFPLVLFPLRSALARSFLVYKLLLFTVILYSILSLLHVGWLALHFG